MNNLQENLSNKALDGLRNSNFYPDILIFSGIE